MKTILTFFLACVLFISGCSPNAHGIVVGKNVHPAYSYMTFIFVGKVLVPMYHYVPERYEVVVKNDDGKQVSVYLNLEDYNKFNIGSRIDTK